MSNAAVYVRWGRPTTGRETKSLEVFGQALEFYGTLKSKGKISEFRTYFATNGAMAQFGGFMLIEGTVAQCRELVDGDDFQKILIKAHHVVDNLEVVHMSMGEEIQKTIGRVLDARKQLGIT